MVQPPNINQTFQISPNQNTGIKYANSIDEVQSDMTAGESPFFSKDMSVVWIKNSKGEIRTFELNEIVPKDEKDLQIEFLQAQIDELKKGMIVNEQHITNGISTKDTTSTSSDDESNGTTIEESKSTSVQRVSTSKKK
jgi:hypothetical protein